MTGGWRDAAWELRLAAVMVAAVAGFTLAFAGLAAAASALAGCGVVALLALRFLAWPRDPGARDTQLADDRAQTTFTGFWRKRADVEAGTQSLAGYDTQLRATLQHVLAARLAERHGVSLYGDPAAARRLLGADDRTWYWLDPARPAVATRDDMAGIPPKTLALLIDQLERL